MKILIYIILAGISFAGCNSFYESSMLEGEWEAYQGIQIMDGDNIVLKIQKNRFYYQYDKWGDAMEPCNRHPENYNFIASEFAEGTFVISNDIITLNGKWLEESCTNEGEFKAKYKCEFLIQYIYARRIRFELLSSEGSFNWGIKKEILLIKK